MSSVRIIGLDKVKGELSGLNRKTTTKAKGAIENGAKTFVRLAKNEAPVDVGFLKNQISYKPVSSLKFEVVSGAKYSPYLEFGTKGKFSPYPGTEQYAAEFKGKGEGSLDDMLLSLVDWVKKKGLADRKTRGLPTGRVRKANDAEAFEVAFRIMLSILKKGVTPQPFFFKQMPIVRKQIIADLQ